MQCFTVAVTGGSGTGGARRAPARKTRPPAPVARPRKPPSRARLVSPPVTKAQPEATPQPVSKSKQATKAQSAAQPQSVSQAQPTAKAKPVAKAQRGAKVPPAKKTPVVRTPVRQEQQAPPSPPAPPPKVTMSRPTRKARRRRPRTPNQNPNRSFAVYMDEISQTDLLEQREVVSLAGEIRAGMQVDNVQRDLAIKLKRRPSLPELAEALGRPPDSVRAMLLRGMAAKNKLVAANLRLVTSVTRKIKMGKTSNAGALALEDMIQEGSVGLIRAAEKFDASRGYKFSTYATWWIRASVLRAITTQSRSIRIPSTIIDEYSRIKKEYVRQSQSGHFEPSEKDIAEALGITVAKLHFVIQVVTQTPASLDLAVGEGSGPRSSLVELVEGDDNVEERMVERMQRMELDRAFERVLKPMERAAVRLRFGLDDGIPRTLKEIGVMLGLSKERVRQLSFIALSKLNTPEVRKTLTDYLD